MVVILASGCTEWRGAGDRPDDHLHDEHGEGDLGDEEHPHRDPELEPCDAANWRTLAPDLRLCQLATSSLDFEILRRVDLTSAELEGASLFRADLFKATLATARLRGAMLDEAKLTGANLAGADLTDASLLGATLTGAHLDGAITTGALTDATTVCTTGQSGPCW